jgi:hypothetical protein
MNFKCLLLLTFITSDFCFASYIFQKLKIFYEYIVTCRPVLKSTHPPNVNVAGA